MADARRHGARRRLSARAAARPADRLQGSVRHRRPHRHRRLQDVREARRHRDLQHGRAADRRRHGAARQAAHGRVRLRRLGHQSADGRAVESLGPQDPSRARRLVERHRRGRRRAAGAGRHRQRHRRLGAHPLGVQRPGRPEGHVRPHRPVRHHAAQLDARFDRPDGAQRRGLRAAAQRARRARPARSDDARPAARGFHRGDQAGLDRGHARRDARHQAAARTSCMPT